MVVNVRNVAAMQLVFAIAGQVANALAQGGDTVPNWTNRSLPLATLPSAKYTSV